MLAAGAANYPTWLLDFSIGYKGCMWSRVPRAFLAAACAAWALPALASGQPDCSSAASSLPPRAASAAPGSEFARRIAAASGLERDALIVQEIRAGNVPPHLRHARAVTLASALPGVPRVTLCVLPDYLAVGSDDDYLLVPLGLGAALSLAGEFGFELPTRRMVDAIYRQAALHLAPRPLPAGDEMRSTAFVQWHTDIVRTQRASTPAPLDVLTAGHKKDLVLTPRLDVMPGRVAIYGWHRADGRPIQPLSLVHGARYADYSHGVRFVSTTAWVDGARRSLGDLLADERLASTVSDEGPIRLSTPLDAIASASSAP